MAKNNFLLVDLNDKQTKKLAETITNDTSRKILNHLTEKEDTEAKIAESLGIPISTVHYHLQKLQEAKLVIADEFHYSKKGREVNHYKLANKYIIIAPKKISGLKSKLREILPVGLIALGISAVLAVFQNKQFSSFSERNMLTETATETAPLALQLDTQKQGMVVQEPNIALWFLIGSVVTLLIYLAVLFVKELKRKRTEEELS